MTTPLAPGYRYEVDALDDQAWLEVAESFRDASLYQLWQLGHRPTFLRDTSRLVLKRGNAIVAAAEVRLFLAPVSRRGIAYVRWGPMWRRSGFDPDAHDFRQAVRALRHEYVCRRKLILRINPRLFVERDEPLIDILRQEGFATADMPRAEQTLLMDLRPELDVLRRGLDRKWRNCLSKAERTALTIEAGLGLHLFDSFMALYRELLSRKQFAPSADLDAHRRLQEVLSDPQKMRCVIAATDGQPCAGAIVSRLGDTAVYLFGATSDMGLKTCASYLVQWEIVKLLKSERVPVYDLHGIDPVRNPGTFHFKKGLAGVHGSEVTFGERFQAFRSSMGNVSLLWAESWYQRRRRLPDRAGGITPAAAVPTPLPAPLKRS